MKTSLTFALALSALAVCTTAPAQTIYRCGPDGRSYSQTPCAGARVVQAQDERTDQQRREAQAVAHSQRDLGESLAADRQAREASLVPARAGLIGGRADPAKLSRQDQARTDVKSKSRDRGRAPRRSEHFEAVAPARRRS